MKGITCLAATVCGLLASLGQSTNGPLLLSTNTMEAPHFWHSVEGMQGATTMLAIGDSMSDAGRSIQKELFRLLREKFGNAGDTWLAYGYPANGASIVDPPPTGPLSTWWSFHFRLPTEGHVDWVQREASYVNRLGIYWFAQPDGGLFNVNIATNFSQWSPTLLQLDGFSESVELRYTNFPVAFNRYKVRAVTVTGTNYLLSPEFRDTNSRGIHVAYIARGSINLNRVFSYPTNLLPAMITTLNPQMVICHMKEIGDIGPTNLATRIGDLEALWQSCATNSDVAYIGTPYDYRDANSEYNAPENLIWREAAIRDHRIYLDCMNPSVSYTAMNSAGWLDYPLDVHPNAVGNDVLAKAVWKDMEMDALRAPRELKIVPYEGGAICRWNSAPNMEYELQASQDMMLWSPIAQLCGTGGILSHTNAPNGGQYYRLRLLGMTP